MSTTKKSCRGRNALCAHIEQLRLRVGEFEQRVAAALITELTESQRFFRQRGRLLAQCGQRAAALLQLPVGGNQGGVQFQAARLRFELQTIPLSRGFAASTVRFARRCRAEAPRR